MEPTKSQVWARNLSKGLKSSYDSSALIEHRVTSGEYREHQVFDILKFLLPNKFAIEKNVVIINSGSEETIKFDGALIDDNNWPKLFADDHVIVSPIESVKIAFEVKSNLGSTEIAKIYKEAQNLKDSSNLPDSLCPKVVGFSYTCANIKLTYYDFVNSFLSNSHYPTMVAILNIGILAFIDEHNSFSKTPDKSCTPVLLETGEDTLLVFTYLLTEFISESHVASAIRKYSNQFFTSMSYFAFEKPFLDAMKKMSAKMRVHFEGKLEIGINDTYDTLKKELGL